MQVQNTEGVKPAFFVGNFSFGDGQPLAHVHDPSFAGQRAGVQGCRFQVIYFDIDRGKAHSCGDRGLYCTSGCGINYACGDPAVDCREGIEVKFCRFEPENGTTFFDFYEGEIERREMGG